MEFERWNWMMLWFYLFVKGVHDFIEDWMERRR